MHCSTTGPRHPPLSPSLPYFHPLILTLLSPLHVLPFIPSSSHSSLPLIFPFLSSLPSLSHTSLPFILLLFCPLLLLSSPHPPVPLFFTPLLCPPHSPTPLSPTPLLPLPQSSPLSISARHPAHNFNLQ